MTKLQMRFIGRITSMRHTKTEGECEDKHFIDRGGFGELYRRDNGSFYIEYWIEREGEWDRWEWMRTADGQPRMTKAGELVLYNEESDIAYEFRMTRWRLANECEWADAKEMTIQDGLWPIWYDKINKISQTKIENEMFHIILNEEREVIDIRYRD